MMRDEPTTTTATSPSMRPETTNNILVRSIGLYGYEAVVLANPSETLASSNNPKETKMSIVNHRRIAAHALQDNSTEPHCFQPRSTLDFDPTVVDLHERILSGWIY
jgi:hypothetical protein